MRKLPFYVCAAVFAAGAMSSTAYGMTAGTYNVPGGRAVVIGGSNMEELKNVLEQIQGSFGGTCSGNVYLGGSGAFGNGECGNEWIWGNMGGCITGGEQQPDLPWDSGKPDVPDKPGDSGKPDVPDKPGDSGKPDVPDKDKPDKPGQGTTQDAYAAQVVEIGRAHV